METETVTIKLAELLRHPDDLDKLPSLKSEFTRKKAAVDSQLRLGLKEQLETTQHGMNSISEGQRTVNLIKEEMQKIDKLCAEAQTLIRDFPHINQVAQVHRNFAQVEQMKNDIDTFEERLEELQGRLEDDEQDLENQPNLLPVHLGLSKLRDVREAAMDQVNSSSDESALELVNNLGLPSGATLQDLFKRLDDVIELFDEHVGLACVNLIPLVQDGNNSMVVRLALIINEEEKRDKKAQALIDAQKEYKDLASRFKSIATGPRELRGYWEKFLKSIEAAAERQIEASNEAFEEDPDKIDKSVKWYFNDLQAVKLGMTPLVPKKWKIFETYVKIYHKEMHNWLISRIDDPDLRPTHLLAIVGWVDKYYAKMRKFDIYERDLEPPLIDGREVELVRDYRQLIIKAVDEWMDRMGDVDRRSFNQRDERALAPDDQNVLRTKTLTDMWIMLNEQLAVATSSERRDVVEGVVDAMFSALESRQAMWQKLVDKELDRYTAKDADQEGLQPFQDWLVAIANDQIVCIDDGDEDPTDPDANLSYLAKFALNVSKEISPEYQETARARIESLRDGYVDLATHCLHVFAVLIFAVDFKVVLSEFFTPTWYTKRGMEQMVLTFEDYLQDYEDALHPSLRDILIEEIADELLVKYLSAVHNKGAKFRRSDPFTDKIKDDVLTVFGFFERYNPFMEIKQKWRVVDGFVRLLETEKHVVPSVFEGFRMDYWDTGLGWVESVLRARDDFERSMLNNVKSKAAEMEVVRGPDTIMSKVK